MLLHKLKYDFKLEVSGREGRQDPLHVYSITCTLYETKRRPNPVPEKLLKTFQSTGVCVVGFLEGHRVEREKVWRGFEYRLKRETQIFVGNTLENTMEQMEAFIQESIRLKDKFRPRRPKAEKAVERLTKYSRGY
ncbi:hypothetical protein ITP31_003855 [Salmonella enterica]|nr:hypothetical protein [Salmonella enterica]